MTAAKSQTAPGRNAAVPVPELENGPGREASIELGVPHERSPIHILVVDDDPSIREVVATLLRNEGFLVSDVETGQEALQATQHVCFNIVITDLMLPDIDGITLFERMMEMTPNLCGIVMTGYGTIDLAVRAIRAGAAEFITKPFQPDMVLLTVRRQLEMLQLRQENAVLKKAVLKSGAIRVQSFQYDDLDPNAPQEASLAEAAYSRGLTEGEQRAKAERDKERALVVTTVRELERTTAAIFDRLEAQSAALAFEIACRVIRQAVEDKQDLIVHQVREALERAMVRGQEEGLILIKVHPDDVVTLEGAREEWAKGAANPTHLVVEGDPAISRGGCRVETLTRLVDATLEAQLLKLGEALKRKTSRGTR